VMITPATGALCPCPWSFDRLDRQCSCALLRRV